jgi:hypothetical protein
MAKTRKQAAAPDQVPMPQIGDKVTRPRSDSVLEITHVSKDGAEVNLQLPGTNLEWFRVKTDTLTFADRKPPARTSNPFTNPEPVFDAGEVLERIDIVRRESLQRIDDDIDILKNYLKTERVPRVAIEALEVVTIDQYKSWKTAVDRIKNLLEE